MNNELVFDNGWKRKKKEQDPWNVLYKKSLDDKELKEERNRLTNISSDNLSQSDILYASSDELKNKLAMNNPLQKGAEYLIGKNYDSKLHNLAKDTVGKDAAGMLDLSHGVNMNDRNYIKDVIHLDNYGDYRVKQDREYLKKKISKQFKDYNFDINKIKGYFFKSDSEPSKKISQNSDFLKTIKNNKKEILSGKEVTINFSGIINPERRNTHYAYGHVDIRNGYIDNNGNLHIKMYDTYDFNKMNKDPLNQAGRQKMMQGELKPYFSIHDIIIPKSKLDEIWK